MYYCVKEVRVKSYGVPFSILYSKTSGMLGYGSLNEPSIFCFFGGVN